MQATGGKGVNLVVEHGRRLGVRRMHPLPGVRRRLATVATSTTSSRREIDMQALHAKRLTLFGVSNKMRTPEQRASGVPPFMKDVMPAIAAGRISP
jgi:NADPH:quinone reductase-like Zn-dependent oxidoreductase